MTISVCKHMTHCFPARCFQPSIQHEVTSYASSCLHVCVCVCVCVCACMCNMPLSPQTGISVCTQVLVASDVSSTRAVWKHTHTTLHHTLIMVCY